MNDSQKLDMILSKLQNQELVPEEQRLHELARKYWGLSERDCLTLKLSKEILDTGKNNSDKTLDFVVFIGGLVKQFGADSVLNYLNKNSES